MTYTIKKTGWRRAFSVFMVLSLLLVPLFADDDSGSGGGGSDDSDKGGGFEAPIYPGEKRDKEAEEKAAALDAARAIEREVLEGERNMDAVEYERLREDIRTKEKELHDYCNEHGYTVSTDSESGRTVVHTAEEKAVSRVGDPVMLASGLFRLDDTDMTVRVGKTQFSLTRHYVSDPYSASYTNRSTFGQNWHAILSSRIILGCAKMVETEAAKWDALIKKGDDAFLKILLMSVNYSNCTAVSSDLSKHIKAWKEQRKTYSPDAELSAAHRARNTHVAYGYPGYMATNLGCDRLIFVDDSGNPIVFEQQGQNYVAVNESVRQDVTISYQFFTYPREEDEDDDDDDDDDYEVHGEYRYTVRFASGETRIYDYYGRLKNITFDHGGTIDFSYRTGSETSSIVVNGVRELTCAWSNGYLSEITDGEQTIRYRTVNGRLTSVCDAEDDTKSYAYDAAGRLSKQIKPDGSFIAFGYETGSDGKVRTAYTINENGAKETFSYDVENRRTTYTDHDGVTSWYEYDAQQRTTRETYANGLTITYAYDENGNLSARESQGNRTTYQYDAANRKIAAYYNDGSSERWAYAGDNLLSYTDRDGVVTSCDYDARGNVTALYRGGQRVSAYEYNAFGQVTRETDCRGNRSEYTYDAQGNCTQKKIFAAGASVPLATEFWAYDSMGRVTEFVDARGVSYAYQYAPHAMFIRASNGYEAEYSYNNRKDLVMCRQTDTVTGEARVYRYEYDNCHNVTRVLLGGTDGAGKNYASAPVQSATYTGHGRLASQIIWGENEQFAYTYQFDGAGSLAYMRYGAADATGVLTAGAYQTHFATAWLSGGGSELSETNGDGRVIVRSYDTQGKLLTERDGSLVRAENQYSAGGRLVSARTAFGGMLSYAYDGATGFYAGAKEVGSAVGADSVQCFADGKKAVLTNPTGNKTYYYYDALGLLCKVVSDGKIEIWAHDGAGRLTAHTITSTTGAVVFREAWTYSADGRTKTYTKGERETWTFKTNAFGELILITDALGNKRGFVYDVRGRCIEKSDAYGKKSRFFYDGKNQLVKSVDRNGNVTSYAYDAAGSCISVTNASGTVFSAQYDQSGRMLSKLHQPAVAQEQYAYDGKDRITAIRQGDDVVLQTVFAADGTQFDRRDANGKTASYKTDGFGRILSEQNRLGAVQTFAFKNDGALLQTSDFAGDKTSYAYDRAANTTTVTHSDGSFTKEERDAAGNILRAENQAERLRFSYDTAGNLLTQHDEHTGARITYTYDVCGRRIRMQSEKQDVRYQYGKNGELLAVSDEVNGIAVHFTYDAAGNETLREHETGERTESFYDGAGRLVLTVGYAANRSVAFVEGSVYNENGFRTLVLNSDLSVTRYRYDKNGRLSEVQYPYSDALAAHFRTLCAEAGLHYNETAAVSADQHRFSAAEYAALQSLCKHIGTGLLQPHVTGATLSESFLYDRNGNLSCRKTPFGTIAYQYDAENRLVSWGNGCTARYDANGNVLEKKNLYKDEYYTYNKMNRMERVTIQDVLLANVTEYTCQYDAFGRRTVVSSQADGAMRSVYDGLTFNDAYVVRERAGTETDGTQQNQTMRYAWIDGDAGSSRMRTSTERAVPSEHATPATDFADAYYVSLYGNGRTPLAVTHVSANTDRYALFADSVGTVKTTLRTDGTQDQYAYDAFGAQTARGGWNPYGFAGKKSIGVAHLYDFGYRDYAADTFRFTTPDPARDGTNWYAYCNGDSVNYVDPWGLELEMVVDKDSHSFHKGEYSGTKDTRDTCIMNVYQEGSLILQVEVTVAVVSHNSSLTYDEGRTQKTGSGTTHPTQFPDGTYNVTAVTTNKTGDDRYDGAWLRTDATQVLQDTKTGVNLEDGGYCIHYTELSMTNGCVGVQSKEQMDMLAWAVIQNEKNDPHSTKITVLSSSKDEETFEKGNVHKND